MRVYAQLNACVCTIKRVCAQLNACVCTIKCVCMHNQTCVSTIKYQAREVDSGVAPTDFQHWMAVSSQLTSYNKSQKYALFLNFILVKNSTCFEQIYCPSSGVINTVFTVTGFCHTSYVDCLLGRSECRVLYQIKLRNSASHWFLL